MKCPICQSKTKVLDSRSTTKGIRRRRECVECLTRFSTYETALINSIDKYLLDKYYLRVKK